MAVKIHYGGVCQVPVANQQALDIGDGERLTGPPQQHHHLPFQLTPGHHGGILRAADGLFTTPLGTTPANCSRQSHRDNLSSS